MGILFSGNGRVVDRKKMLHEISRIFHSNRIQTSNYLVVFGGAIFSVINVLRFLNDLRFTMICATLPASPLADQYSNAASIFKII